MRLITHQYGTSCVLTIVNNVLFTYPLIGRHQYHRWDLLQWADSLLVVVSVFSPTHPLFTPLLICPITPDLGLAGSLGYKYVRM